MYNLYLKKEINGNDFQITYAKKGIFKEINKIPILVLQGWRNNKIKLGNLTNFKFSKSDFPLNNLNQTPQHTKTQEVSTFKLLKCINSIYLSKLKKQTLKLKIVH